MTKNIILIGDTHFGIKNNSMTWLKHQKSGFEEIISYLEESTRKYDETLVVHLGDLFDSRSSINPLIFKEVRDLLIRVGEVLDGKGRMWIIGGNHDYYYPWESKRNYTGIQMLPDIPNVETLVDGWQVVETRDTLGSDLVLVPWFDFHNPEKLEDVVSGTNPYDIILTHTDPFHWEKSIQGLIGEHPVVTGHIHQPHFDNDRCFRLVTGATFPTDFTDTNTTRGFWTLELDPQKSVEMGIHDALRPVFHEVKSSIHFHTLDEGMLQSWKELGIGEDDYVEVIIPASKMEYYKETIKELNDSFTTSITPLPEMSDRVFEATEVLNVDTVCHKLLPPNLIVLYNEMVERLKGSV